MNAPIGLVTGFEPYAGLPTNPAGMILPHLDGEMVGGCAIVARTVPVSHARLPRLLGALIDELRPVFVMGMGQALGANGIRVEKYALNTAAFAIADNDGARPRDEAIEPDGPDGRAATWDAAGVVEAILDAGIPARLSHHAGTHLCNLMLYCGLSALEHAGSAAPCGFLHLPYLPEQVVWLIRQHDDRDDKAPVVPLDQPSMAFETQLAAARAAVAAIARQARAAT